VRNYFAIVRKELYGFFVSPIAYAVLGVFYAVSGYFFFGITTSIIESLQQMGFQSQQFGSAPPPMDAFSLIMSNIFNIISTIFLLVMPLITMGIFAEEKKRGTVELLFTSPLTHLQLILGKFTAAMAFLLVMLVPTILKLCLLYFYSDPLPPLTPVLNGFLGALLLGGALLSLGIFASSLTESQIVAGILSFGFFIILWVVDWMAGASSTLGNEVLRYLSIMNHYEDFTKGVLDTSHVFFYLSLIFMGLFLTSVSLNSPKWRS
jgi:ABC-2 type transport system permease protein